MIFQMGGVQRPNNEVVASVSYSPSYSATREIATVTETWAVRGRVVLQGADATAANMSAEIKKVNAMVELREVDIAMLDDNGAPTPWKISASACSEGPRANFFSWTNSQDDVYTNGQGYSFGITAVRPISASGIVSFNETLQVIDAGGQEYVHVGGSINQSERQLGSQYLPWRAVQSGTIVGLLDYANPPPPIFPFAMKKPNQAFTFTRQSPQKPGKIDTNFPLSWAYEYEWYFPLFGQPNRI